MENELYAEQEVPSGILTGITISILDEEDAVSIFFFIDMIGYKITIITSVPN